MSETIVTGKKYRILTDVAQKVWQRVSFWTKSTDVEFNDAKTAETKVGAIDGITDSLSSNSSRIAASAKAVNQLNGDLSNKSNVGHGHDAIAGIDNSGHSLQFKWDSANSGILFYIDGLGPFFDTANFRVGVNTLYNKCVNCGVTPSENSPTGISNAIQTIYNNRYNEGYSAGVAATAPTLTYLTNNFSEPVLITNPNAHRITSNADLTSYKYVIVCFGYRNAGMSLDGSGYAFTNCTIYSYDAAGSLGIAVLQNVKNGATIDFQHASGTGSGNRIVWGIK